MKNPHEALLTALMNARGYKARYEHLLGPIAAALGWTRLDEVIENFGTQAATQMHRSKQAEHGTVTKADRRTHLRVHQMTPIWMMARATLLNIAPSKLSRFDVPPATTSDVSLIAAAQGMATVANEFRQTFVAQGLPGDFVEQLQAAAAELQGSIVERDGDRLQSRRATIGADTQAVMAREVLGILTSLVIRQFEKQPDLIGEWKSAIRIRRKPGVARGTTGGAGGNSLPVLKQIGAGEPAAAGDAAGVPKAAA